jgi:hypothetical protein
MTVTELQLALGRKVAEQRRRHGWSQPELAHRLGKPVSWVSQLERGLVIVQPLPVLPAVPGAVLPSGPSVVVPDSVRPQLVEALRRVLDEQHKYRPRPEPLAVQTVAGRQALTARVWNLTVSGHYGELAELVCALIPVVRATLWAAPPHQRAGLHELLAASYQGCSAALVKLADYDGAAAAADLSLAAAELADDPVAVASSAYLLVCILMDAGCHDSAQTIAAAAAAALVPSAASGSVTAISFRGALTLLCALCAARIGDSAAAQEYLSRARVMAGRLSGIRGDNLAGFSADHVALYEIAVSIESAATMQTASPAD